MSINIGQTIDSRYRLDHELGRGGMGTVFRAMDLRLGKGVALKVLGSSVAEDPDTRSRFHSEAQAMVSLRHPHIVTVTDFVDRPGLCFLVMELVAGGSLGAFRRAYSERGLAFPEDAALSLCRQAATGLAHAHATGVLHRDIKPDNLLCEQLSEYEGAAARHLKIADFGIAQLRNPGFAKHTIVGAFIGTPAYASLEQLEGRSIDERSDIYALGCVLYEMLSGTSPVPFDSSDTDQQRYVRALDVQRQRRRTPIARLRPGLNPATVEIVDACLARDPTDRFANASALAQALEKAEVGLKKWDLIGATLAPAVGPDVSVRPAFNASHTPLTSPRLRVRSSDGPEQRFALTRAGLTVGRADTNQVVLRDPAVSSQHLRVAWDGAAVSVTDLGSTNGTLLNGQRLASHMPTQWPWHVSLRLGDSWLHLDRPMYTNDTHSERS